MFSSGITIVFSTIYAYPVAEPAIRVGRGVWGSNPPTPRGKEWSVYYVLLWLSDSSLRLSVSLYLTHLGQPNCQGFDPSLCSALKVLVNKNYDFLENLWWSSYIYELCLVWKFCQGVWPLHLFIWLNLQEFHWVELVCKINLCPGLVSLDVHVAAFSSAISALPLVVPVLNYKTTTQVRHNSL